MDLDLAPYAPLPKVLPIALRLQAHSPYRRDYISRMLPQMNRQRH